MKTSVAMATYNGEQYIQEQLNSFEIQTILPDELIIVDDGSTDDTLKICQEFSKKSSFSVKVYSNDNNLGYNKSFESALNSCTGDIIFVSDQDDFWYPNKIERILECFKKNPSKFLIIHDLEYCDSHLRPIGQTKVERISSFKDPMRSYVTGMATVIKFGLLKICLPLPNSEFINYDNWLHNCAEIINKKYILNEVLSYYRRHENNATISNNLNVSFKTNKWYFFKELIFQKNENYNKEKKELNKLSEVKKWVSDNRNELINQFSIEKADINNAIVKINTKYRFINQRIELRKKNIIYRLLFSTIFLIKGNYKEFSGFKSYLRDVI